MAFGSHSSELEGEATAVEVAELEECAKLSHDGISEWSCRSELEVLTAVGPRFIRSGLLV